MARTRKLSRRILIVTVTAAVIGVLAVAFRPQPTLVDLGIAARAPLMVTIDEEGRTRVRESYVVSTPVAGRLLRVEVHAGDAVERGEIVAQLRPINPAALDARTREQARAVVDASEAALRLAQADFSAATAANELAQADLQRTMTLAASGIASRAALERAESTARAAGANLETATAVISMREAELTSARAQLIGFDGPDLSGPVTTTTGDEIPLGAPISGRILQILQESETVLPAGAPVMEIGDIEGALEVVVDLLSSDAVQVEVGARVLIEDWGGDAVLEGEVARVEPFGVTRLSALGVEEQRVGVIVRFISGPEERIGLGHGYRLEARIVTWESTDTLTVPASAIFVTAEGPALFKVVDGIANQILITTGQSDGLTTEVLGGLSARDTVVLYPSPSLTSGAQVAQRVAE